MVTEKNSCLNFKEKKAKISSKNRKKNLQIFWKTRILSPDRGNSQIFSNVLIKIVYFVKKINGQNWNLINKSSPKLWFCQRFVKNTFIYKKETRFFVEESRKNAENRLIRKPSTSLTDLLKNNDFVKESWSDQQISSKGSRQLKF